MRHDGGTVESRTALYHKARWLPERWEIDVIKIIVN